MPIPGLRTSLPYLFCLGLLSGCGRAGDPPEHTADSASGLEFVDDAGRTVTFQHHPRRVIPLAPNLTELLYTIGAGPNVAAVSIADDYPPQVDSLPRYSSFPVDYEALVAFKPDALLATDAINNPRDADLFTSVGLPIVYYSFKTWDDIPRVMRAMGRLLGEPGRADAAADSLEARLANVSALTASTTPVRTLFLIGSDQLYAFGRDNYIHDAIARAGGESLTADIDAVSPILSEEFVLTVQPDAIIGTFRSAQTLLKNHPALRNVPAVVDGRVCTVPSSLVLRPGPRLLEGIEEMAKCLHPALFASDNDDKPGLSAR